MPTRFYLFFELHVYCSEGGVGAVIKNGLFNAIDDMDYEGVELILEALRSECHNEVLPRSLDLFSVSEDAMGRAQRLRWRGVWPDREKEIQERSRGWEGDTDLEVRLYRLSCRFRDANRESDGAEAGKGTTTDRAGQNAAPAGPTRYDRGNVPPLDENTRRIFEEIQSVTKQIKRGTSRGVRRDLTEQYMGLRGIVEVHWPRIFRVIRGDAPEQIHRELWEVAYDLTADSELRRKAIGGIYHEVTRVLARDDAVRLTLLDAKTLEDDHDEESEASDAQPPTKPTGGGAADDAGGEGGVVEVPSPKVTGGEPLKGRLRQDSWSPPEKALGNLNRTTPRSEVELTDVGFSRFVARSEAARRAATFAFQCLDKPGPILIVAPTACGKEMLARDLRDIYNRKRGIAKDNFCEPFPCGALSIDPSWGGLVGVVKGAGTGVQPRKGAIGDAGEGLLILDEFHAPNPDRQNALLQMLQAEHATYTPVGSEKSLPVKCKIVVCTSEDLWALAEKGDFHPPLLNRLQPQTVWIPPLHERREDIVGFCDQRLGQHSPPITHSRTELEIVAEFIVEKRWDGRMLADRLADPEAATLVSMFPELSDEFADSSFTRDYVTEVLQQCDGNVQAAGVRLYPNKPSRDAARMTLSRLLKKLGVDASNFKSTEH